MPELPYYKVYPLKKNREVPPLRYEDVYRLKHDRPELLIEINGGIKTFAETQQHLKHVDGVMTVVKPITTLIYRQSLDNYGALNCLTVLKLCSACCRILNNAYNKVRLFLSLLAIF